MLPEEVTKLIGQSLGTRIFEVEKGAIRKFADAVDDQNPLYWDEEYARNSRHGSIIAPPGFFGWPAKGEGGAIAGLEAIAEVRNALAKAGYGRLLDGGVEYEFFKPVRARDTLAVSLVIKDIVEREGKTGKFVLLITETSYMSESGDLVARARATRINR